MNLSRGIYWHYLIFIIILLPFLYNFSVFNPFELPKFLVFVGGVFLIALYCLVESIKRKKTYHTSLTPLGISICLYVLITLLSDFLGEDVKISLIGSVFRHQGFITLLSGVLVYMLVAMIPKDTISQAFLFFGRLVFVSTVGICIVALYHFFASRIFHDNTIPLYGGRIVGTFGNPNFLSGYLVITLPFIVFSKPFLKKYISHKLLLLLILIVVCLIFFVIVISQSRANLFFGVCMLFPILLVRVSGLQRLLLGITILTVVISLSHYYPFFLTTNKRESLWESRNLIYSTGIEAVFKKPLLGYGQENFEFLFPLSRHIKVDNAHNIFLEIAVSSGIVGLFIFCLLLYFSFLKAPLLVKTSLFGFLLIAQINPLSIAHIAFFWLLLGFADTLKDGV